MKIKLGNCDIYFVFLLINLSYRNISNFLHNITRLLFNKTYADNRFDFIHIIDTLRFQKHYKNFPVLVSLFGVTGIYEGSVF